MEQPWRDSVHNYSYLNLKVAQKQYKNLYNYCCFVYPPVSATVSIAAIAGGIVGAILVVLLVILVIIFLAVFLR